MLRRKTIPIRALGRMSRDEIISLIDWDHPLRFLGADGSPPEICDAEGRPVCPTGLVLHDEGVRRIIATEADAREYQTGVPGTYWGVSAFRIIRATRGELQEAAEAKRKGK